MNKPETWALDKLRAADLGKTVVWCSRRLRPLVQETFSCPVVSFPSQPPLDLDTVIVIGGGSIIDEAKLWRVEHNPGKNLVAIPSIWGSGAESSPVAVVNRENKKVIRMGREFVPNVRVIWAELADSVPPEKIRHACGDVWAHALEGYLSPLAGDEVRKELAAVIKQIIQLPLACDPNWFEVSSQASVALSRAGPGLAHGIAHTLEGILKQQHPDKYFGHAQLCASFLWPVMSLNRKSMAGMQRLFQAYEIDIEAVFQALKALFDEDIYDIALPAFEVDWKSILRDPATRTNSVLVRPDSLAYFVRKEFE